MKNISTGFGLCVAAAAALAYPFVNSLAPSANASAVTAAASAVSTAASGQTGPTIVWYGVADMAPSGSGEGNAQVVYRAWSDGRIELRRVRPTQRYGNYLACQNTADDQPCVSPWYVINNPAQGLTYRSDINFDAKVDGADLGALLADWGDAPRQDIPPSDCPLALINP
jgi:hypothetical protein